MNTAVQPKPLMSGMITISIMLATIMQALDMTIANVALPHMQGSLSATQDQISWVLTSYIVAAAIMTPLTGVLARSMGRKRLFAIMVIGFTLSSMLCGAATSLTEIVMFRILQGLFGAGLVPLSQAVLLDTYPVEKHGSAMALWGVGVMVGPILGPTLGGYLTEFYNWRWVFYINLPFGILALLGILIYVPETAKERDGRFDYLGFALLSIAIGSLQLMLDRGQTLDWFSSKEIILETTCMALCLYLFLVHMFTTNNPFLKPALFRDRNFSVALFLIFMLGIILFSTLALLPPFLQNLKGAPVITTGFVLAPRGLGTMLAMIIVGRLINKVDVRLLILIGIILTAFSLWEMTNFTIEVPLSYIIKTGIIQGLGLGFIFVPLSTIAFSTLPSHFRNEGTAIFSLLRNIGSSIGISIVVTLLAQNTQINHANIADKINPFQTAMHAPWLPQAWNWQTTTGVTALNNEVTRQAMLIAYINDFKLLMWIALCSLPLVFLLKKKSHTPAKSIPDISET